MTDTAMPVLYSFRRCPYAMRARLALAISGTRCTLREVKLSNKPQAMLDVSPKGTVPVLVTERAEVVEESLDIMRYALGRQDPENWLARDDAALVAANDGAFKHDLDRYKYPERHGSDAMHHRGQALEFLTTLNARIGQSGNLCGERRGLADMAIMPFIRQFAAVDRDWWAAQTLPALQGWLKRHLKSDLFKSIMQREKPWQPGDPPVTFAPTPNDSKQDNDNGHS